MSNNSFYGVFSDLLKMFLSLVLAFIAISVLKDQTVFLYDYEDVNLFNIFIIVVYINMFVIILYGLANIKKGIFVILLATIVGFSSFLAQNYVVNMMPGQNYLSITDSIFAGLKFSFITGIVNVFIVILSIYIYKKISNIYLVILYKLILAIGSAYLLFDIFNYGYSLVIVILLSMIFAFKAAKNLYKAYIIKLKL
jgi:hypothetical protein